MRDGAFALVRSVVAMGVRTVERQGEYVRLTFWNSAGRDGATEKMPVSQIVMERAHYRLAVVELTNPAALGE